MLKTNATKIALDRKSRSFRVVFAALSVFFFIFSAEGALDEENNMGRSLLQDHSSAHAVWHGHSMDEKGEFWDRVGGHFDRNRREEEGDGPVRGARFSLFFFSCLPSCILNTHIPLSLPLSLCPFYTPLADAY